MFPDAQSPASDILVEVPVKPDVLQKLDQAASTAQPSRDAWIARFIQNNLPAVAIGSAPLGRIAGLFSAERKWLESPP